jgi:hypothetical protein
LSCWVAPRIAAEIWGVSVSEILELIAHGRLLSCIDGGFSFVRLPQFAIFGQRLPIERRPPTFNPVSDVVHFEKPPNEQIVTPAEQAALSDEHAADESELGPPPDEDPNDNRIAGWREGRKRAGAMRRGPTGPSTSP